MSDTIKGFRGKDGPILLDYGGLANVPGAIKSIGALTARPGDHFEVETVDSTAKIITVKAVEKPGGSGSGQNVTLTTAQINALDGMFKVCAYDDNKDVSGAYAAFLAAFNLADSEGENPGGGGSGETQTVDLATIGDVESGTDINGNASSYYIRYTVQNIKAGDIITTHAPDKNTTTGLFVADGVDVTADATYTAASEQYNGTTIYVYTFVAPSDCSIFRVAARTNYVSKGFRCTITREV